MDQLLTLGLMSMRVAESFIDACKMLGLAGDPNVVRLMKNYAQTYSFDSPQKRSWVNLRCRELLIEMFKLYRFCAVDGQRPLRSEVVGVFRRKFQRANLDDAFETLRIFETMMEAPVGSHGGTPPIPKQFQLVYTMVLSRRLRPLLQGVSASGCAHLLCPPVSLTPPAERTTSWWV